MTLIKKVTRNGSYKEHRKLAFRRAQKNSGDETNVKNRSKMMKIELAI